MPGVEGGTCSRRWLPAFAALGLLAVSATPFLEVSREKHLGNIRQLTFEGDNGEAYFSPDGKRIVFQSKRLGSPFDQIYILDLDGSRLRQISDGSGRTTCSYFDPQKPRLIYSSTHHLRNRDNRPKSTRPAGSGGATDYQWEFDPKFDIFVADLEGRILKQLTESPGYDAEATFSPSGRRIVFTSSRDNDLEIYSMDRRGGDILRLTFMPGYDGGAFYSPDESQIIFRGARGDDYRALQLYRMNADGSAVQPLTHLRGTSFAPFWHPSGEKIIFCSNHQDFRNFDLFLLQLSSGEIERVTVHPTFDGFPVFSPDGKHLLFASNRAGDQRGKTHIFLADWLE